MKKVIRIGFPIVCVVIIGGTFYMINKLDKKVEGSLKNQYSNSTNTSTEVENETALNEDKIQNDVSYTVPVNNLEKNETNSNSVSNEIDNESNNSNKNMTNNQE